MEIPYIALQTIVYGIITFFMINFERTISEFYYFLSFLTSHFITSLILKQKLHLVNLSPHIAGKFLLYILFMFLTFTYFTFYGMMAVGLTPSQHLAAVVSSAFYSLWNLLSGFLVPKPVSLKVL